MIFAKRITSLKLKLVFAERIPLKNGTRIDLILLTKISVNSRRDYTRKSEQTVLANRLANQLTNAENEFCLTWRSQSADLTRLHIKIAHRKICC